MSKLAKMIFFATTTATLITIGTVHYIQQVEKDRMYAGVLRDEARQAVRKQREKERVIQEQQVLHEKNQSVTISLEPENSNERNT
ncbi:uncharacterized protein T551_00866 [Pneumocystis jirovecii RU7]|uniref:Protein PET117, mitochondrial n=1 Tax=Pneumocystis jirovecii (strain RU7) TaxID=1408657 RepID=A0A0W4ZUX7_PNEJ7|nr:uncharacterized protein T551_00866 [Pneumocystis jirovecii RU7]KTW32184.1 hypothetical protein T551_00866 [Pneumocystis jirovecii RU7]